MTPIVMDGKREFASQYDAARWLLERDGIVADSAVGGGAVIIPLGAAFLHGTEYIEGFLEHAVIDVAGGGAQMNGLLAVVLGRSLSTEAVGTEKFGPEIGEIFKVPVIGVGRSVFILPGLA